MPKQYSQRNQGSTWPHARMIERVFQRLLGASLMPSEQQGASTSAAKECFKKFLRTGRSLSERRMGRCLGVVKVPSRGCMWQSWLVDRHLESHEHGIATLTCTLRLSWRQTILHIKHVRSNRIRRRVQNLEGYMQCVKKQLSRYPI